MLPATRYGGGTNVATGSSRILPSTTWMLGYRRSVSPRARTQAGSISTAATCAVLGDSSTVSVPMPAPTSTTSSVLRSSRAPTIRSSWCRSARKFWPQLRRKRMPKRRAMAHMVERNDTGSADDAVRRRVGDGRRKGDVKAPRQRFGSDRRIPAETVEHALDAGEFVQNGELIRKRVARMQHNRLANLLRQSQHLPK